jgi:RNA polymerase sigma-70 factor (ECF subfamily)
MRVRRHDRHTFTPELVELMIDVASEPTQDTTTRSNALRDCVKELPERSREFLQIRYAQQQSIRDVAEKTGRSEGAVKGIYLRIRRALEHCIDRKLAAEAKL